MPMKLNRWKDSWTDRNFRNGTNDNWDKIEGSYNSIEEDSTQAKDDSIIARAQAEEANRLSQDIRKQLDEIVINGDSSVEAAQAREDIYGKTHPTLKYRIDKIDSLTKQEINVLSPPGNLTPLVPDFNGISGTDNTNALWSIIEFAKNNKIYKLAFPKGNYLIKNKFVIEFSDIEIDGQGSTLYYNGDSDVQFSQIDGSTRGFDCGYFTIRGKKVWSDTITGFIPKEIAVFSTATTTSHMYSKIKLATMQSDVKVNDYLRIRYELGTSSNHEKKYEPGFQTLAKVIDKDSDWIYLDYYTPFKFDVNAPVLSKIVEKVDVVKNIKVRNFNFVDLREDTYKPEYGEPSLGDGPNRSKCLSGIGITFAENVEIENIQGNRMKLPVVYSRYTRNVKMNNISSIEPMNLGGGAGYTVHCEATLYQDVQNIYGQYTNPVVDFSATSFSNAKNVYGWKSNTVAFNMHGQCEHHNHIENVFGGIKLASGQTDFQGLVSDNTFKHIKGQYTGYPGTYVFNSTFDSCKFDIFKGFNPYNVKFDKCEITFQDVFYPLANENYNFTTPIESSAYFENCDLSNYDIYGVQVFLNLDKLIFNNCRFKQGINASSNKFKIHLIACKYTEFTNCDLNNVNFVPGMINPKNSKDLGPGSKMVLAINGCQINISGINKGSKIIETTYVGSATLQINVKDTTFEIRNTEEISFCNIPGSTLVEQSKINLIMNGNKVINHLGTTVTMQIELDSRVSYEDQGNYFANILFKNSYYGSTMSQYVNCNFELSRKPRSFTGLPESVSSGNYVKVLETSFNSVNDFNVRTIVFECFNINAYFNYEIYFKGFLKYQPAFNGSSSIRFGVSELRKITANDIYLLEEYNSGGLIKVGVYIKNINSNADRIYVNPSFNDGFFQVSSPVQSLPPSNKSVNPNSLDPATPQ
ncbi:hypothetical protein [Bacillus wiedmannii]|uniref:hypothetical protein n=1 Tax=Bacillus wiedmannii TaxID=1890302 RepID=UPI000BFE6D87|nr:hypothetical protein [Bacillus wiedmannii]PHF94241.1 hypothetical protein COI45_15700 [Bacillus wiedmannii]